jgi:hypothetical protein
MQGAAPADVWRLGDSVRVAGVGTTDAHRLSGIAKFGSGVELLGTSLAIFVSSETQRLTSKEGQLDEVRAIADAGVSPMSSRQATHVLDQECRAQARVWHAERQSARHGDRFGGWCATSRSSRP